MATFEYRRKTKYRVVYVYNGFVFEKFFKNKRKAQEYFKDAQEFED